MGIGRCIMKGVRFLAFIANYIYPALPVKFKISNLKSIKLIHVRIGSRLFIMCQYKYSSALLQTYPEVIVREKMQLSETQDWRLLQYNNIGFIQGDLQDK